MSKPTTHYLQLYSILGALLLLVGGALAALTVWRMADGVLFIDTALLSVSVIIIGAVAILLGREFGHTKRDQKKLSISSVKEGEIE